MTWLLGIGILVGAAAISTFTVAASIRVASRWSFYDHPDSERKFQDRPIPKLGGLAVALAFTLTACCALLVSGRVTDLVLALGVLVPALGAAVVGSLDDRWNLNPWVRLGLQAGLALLAWVSGTRIDVVGVPWMDLALFIVWVMLIVNGVNLLDNSDGLAGLTVLIAACGATAIAVVYGQLLVSAMGLALVGVSIGFLAHNWHPARVYLGDGGAYFLGFLLALLTVRVRPEAVSTLEGVLIAALLVSLPLVDTAYVTVTRLMRGTHPFTAGRDHLSHLLQGRGMSIPWSVITLTGCYLVSVIIGVGLALRGHLEG